jgi:hypothetical protein
MARSIMMMIIMATLMIRDVVMMTNSPKITTAAAGDRQPRLNLQSTALQVTLPNPRTTVLRHTLLSPQSTALHHHPLQNLQTTALHHHPLLSPQSTALHHHPLLNPQSTALHHRPLLNPQTTALHHQRTALLSLQSTAPRPQITASRLPANATKDQAPKRSMHHPR